MAGLSGLGSGGKEGPINTKGSLPISLVFFEDFDLDILFCLVLTYCWSRDRHLDLTEEVAVEVTLKASLETP